MSMLVYDKFKAGRSICSYMPIKVPNGGFIEELKAACPDCKRKSHDMLFRGSVVVAFDAVIVDGHGYCKSCKHLFAVLIRYKVIDGKLNATYLSGIGVWQSGLTKTRVGGIEKIKKLLQRLT
ncbi:hypothetical protein QTV49_003940 [Vibrio vulnificus]|nr:hypothetical protein [Vibrio vulnificus]